MIKPTSPSPLARLVARLTGHQAPAPPAPQPEEPEIEPTVKNTFPFVKYGD